MLQASPVHTGNTIENCTSYGRTTDTGRVCGAPGVCIQLQTPKQCHELIKTSFALHELD